MFAAKCLTCMPGIQGLRHVEEAEGHAGTVNKAQVVI